MDCGNRTGKPRAGVGLILRTLKTLGVSLDIAVDCTEPASAARESGRVDINNILSSLNQLIALLDGREVGIVHYKDSRSLCRSARLLTAMPA